MRTLRLPALVKILAVPLATATVGCSGALGGRSNLAPQIKTITWVGDKPEPVVAGTPGNSVSSTEVTPSRPKDASGRISGRVLDVQGRPVPNARVRLAVSTATGGRAIRATTDASGGFTLHGLRPGGSYTLIAEGDDPQGVITGRASVQAPNTRVQIRLRDLVDAPVSNPPARVSPASNRSDVDEDDGSPATPRRRRRLNEEDLPPAPEAETISSADARTDSPARLSAPLPSSRWRRGSRGQDDESSAPTDEETSRSSGVSNPEDDPVASRPEPPAGSIVAAPREADDEGPNPLPPAIEPGRMPVPPRHQPEAKPQDPPPAEQQEQVPAPAEAPAASEPSAPPAAEPMPAPSESPAPSPGEPAPLSSGPATDPPVTLPPATDPPAEQVPAEPPAQAPQGAMLFPRGGPKQPGQAVEPPTELAAVPYDPFALTKAAPLDASPRARTAGTTDPATAQPIPRPTWGQVASKPTRLAGEGSAPRPIGASGRQARGLPVSRPGSATNAPGGALLASRNDGSDKAYCRYDSRRQRLVDFRLPDLDGKTVRFQDLNADYILLDFWGTWCGYCVESIPHLIALQSRYGADRLKVVGIAYEDGPLEQRPIVVRETARRMGINYPLLLGGLDGTCPLQTALHVQAYPTMILIDRYGRILWRDTGATDATLSRLDRVLASATRGDFVRR